MIKRIMLSVCFTLLLAQNLQGGLFDNLKNYFFKEQNTPPTTRILIVNDKPAVQLEVKGKYRIYDPADQTHLSTRLMGKKNAMQTFDGGLKWGEEFPGVHQIVIVPEGAVTTVIDGKEYPGKIYVYDIGGTISIVNEVDIETYVKSLLTSEVREPLAHEALSAVVIAARTNALYQSMHPKNAYWDVDADIVEYRGLKEEDANQELNESLKLTRYMVLNKEGSDESSLAPFPAVIGSPTGGQKKGTPLVQSRISLFDMEQLAEGGHDARQILKRAYPGSSIVLSY